MSVVDGIGGGFSEGFDRVPPQDVAAEQSVLGSMMLSKDAILEVAEVITSVDYYQPKHETIHEVIVELSGRGEPADAITVAGELRRRGDLQRIGGAPYLHTLISSVPTAANATYYARIVRERSIMRRLVSAGTRIVQMGYSENGADVDQIVDEAQAEVYAIAEKRNRDDYVQFSEMSEAILEELEDIANRDGELTGVPTGFADLDDLTQGLHPGQMIIVAGRPGMGKSTLALDFCRSASIHHGITSAIFSLEMSKSEIAMRLLSAETGVFLEKMRSGKMTTNDWTAVSKKLSEVSSAPLFIDDSPNMSLMEIRAKCRRLKQQHNLGMMVVDYLQLMSSGRQVESRQQEVSEFSRQLKLLAKEIEIPVIAVAQLNRQAENRTDKKPMIADLRESGSLEQDADVIMLLHRPDYYNEDERVGEADIMVAKHRNGQTRTIPVAFQGQMARFANMARTSSPDQF